MSIYSEFEELKKNFDVLVSMNEQHTDSKGVSIATFGLRGCIGGYIDNSDTNTFFHYSVLRQRMIDLLVKELVSEKTNKVHFFIPEEDYQDDDGIWQSRPNKRYVDQILRVPLAYIRSKGIDCIFHCYIEDSVSGADYQGTAWVDKQGTLFFEGEPVHNNLLPKFAITAALQL